MSKTKKIESPTNTLLSLNIGETVKDVRTHQISIESTISRLKKVSKGNWSIKAVSEFEIEITRTK